MSEDFEGKMHDGELEEQGLRLPVLSFSFVRNILYRKFHVPNKEPVIIFWNKFITLITADENSSICTFHPCVHWGRSLWSVLEILLSELRHWLVFWLPHVLNAVTPLQGSLKEQGEISLVELGSQLKSKLVRVVS